MEEEKRYSVDLCVTHKCNLNCIYCYQKHSNDCKMDFETAKKSINYIFSHIPSGFNSVEIDFIGGEPLLEFELIKKIVNYVEESNFDFPYIFFATTNGTLLDDEKKEWFKNHRDIFYLGLSLDGKKETHDYNRSNSFDKIDIEFFKKNWPEQGVKMTLSEFSLNHLAENIKYVHSLGFNEIAGVNLAEGNFDWSDEKFIKILVPQLEELKEYYLEHYELKEHLLDKDLAICESKNVTRKYCGIGEGMIFIDYDGEIYPCPFCTPMTFSVKQLAEIKSTDFTKDENFVDYDCFKNCYLYPICSSCSGNNFLKTGCFNKHDRSKCKITKLMSLFIADLKANKILENKDNMDDTTRYWTIEAIKKIKSLYLPEFEMYLK